MNSIDSVGLNRINIAIMIPMITPHLPPSIPERWYFREPFIILEERWIERNETSSNPTRVFCPGMELNASETSKLESISKYVFIDLNSIVESSILKISQVKKIIHWVMINEEMTCNFGHSLRKCANTAVSDINLWVTRRIPWTRPHRAKFQEAPCHKPPRIIVIINAANNLVLPCLFPPKEMYR